MPADEDSKVFDIAKPGDSSPSSTSKPVIVGHKNMIEDPMVKASASATLDGAPEEGDETKADKEPGEGFGPHKAEAIIPPTEAVGAKPDEAAETPAADSEKAEPTPAPAPESDKPAGASDSLPETDESKPAEKNDKVDEEEKAKEEAIQKLIENKQYVVHVGESHHRKLSKTTIIIIAAVVLLLAAFTAFLLK